MSIKKKRSIYFDNAATSFPKPEPVYQAQDVYFRQAANPGRGSYGLALESARKLFEIRLGLAKFLGISDASRLIFTAGGTQAINMALKGFELKRDDLVLTSALEHNAVMRPLSQLIRNPGIRVMPLPYAGKGVIDCRQLAESVKDLRPKLLVVSGASNVTGDLADLPAIAEICRGQGIPVLVDAAQTAGLVEQNVSELGVSLWCASGHKSLMGPPGVGLLYVHPDVDLVPIIAGGTGSASERLEMPDFYPDHLEAGTLPGPAIAGLGAAVDWLKAAGIESVREHEMRLTERFMAWAADFSKIKIYGPPAHAARAPIVSFSLDNLAPGQVADLLDQNYGIAVRPGLHCASSAHKALGTLGSGLVRASFGFFNNADEVDELCLALTQIA